MSIVTLITDYGTRDHYAGVLSGVILGIAPDACIVDITHEIEPQNVLHGAFVIRQSWPWFPAGTIHLVVVDPGVGTDRRIILGRYAGQFVVAPDNGLVTLVHHDFPAEKMHVVESTRYFLPTESTTFHGRDIMAPVAAHLAKGTDPGEFGRAIDDPKLLPIDLEAESDATSLTGRVLHVDRFGTMITNIRLEQLAALPAADHAPEVLVNDSPIGSIREAFSDVTPGELVAFVGGADLLEVAVNRGRAVDRFGPVDNVRVQVR